METKYRIKTNGIKYKAQIKVQDIWTLFFPTWETLQRHVEYSGLKYPMMFVDIEFDTYGEAEQAAIKKLSIKKVKKKKDIWEVTNREINLIEKEKKEPFERIPNLI